VHPEREIERYVVEGLPPEAEEQLRRHLRDCASCRARYDAEQQLAAALAGDTDGPAPAAARALEARLLGAVFPATKAARRPWLALFEGLLWAPRPALAGAAAVFAVLVLVVVVVAAPGAPGIAATVVRSQGAEVVSAGQRTALTPGAAVPALDVVSVPRGGMLELSLERGGGLRVFSQTALVLGRRGETVALDHGKIWCLPEEGRGTFEVTTPTATARVLGTSFIVVAGNDSTDVRVVSGAVEVKGADGRGRVVVHGDEGTKVARGQSPTPARRTSVTADTNEWQRLWDSIVQGLKEGIESIGRGLSGGTK